MKVMCNQCGKVVDLMEATSFAVDENGQLKTYHFCSDEHMKEFAVRKNLPFSKN